MGLFSFLRKNKQESASSEGAFSSRAEEESNAIRGRGKRKQGAQPADPVLPEKKRARRRLVGAIALVLAMIIGLPMVLDSEPKPLADDIAIQIPSKNKAISSAASHQAAAVSSSSGSAAAPASDMKQEIVGAPAAPAAPASAMAATSTTGTPGAVKVPDANKATGAENAASPPQSAIKTDGNPHPRQIAKAEPQAPAVPAAGSAEDAARAIAILEGKPEVKASTAKTASDKKPGKFVVQVAALAAPEKVSELQGRLKSAGVASYTQKVATESGTRIRIRVGPFDTKEEAEQLRAKLAKLGLRSSLVSGSH